MASAYPTAIDSVATLLAPRDKSSGKSIATTTTASILSGDTTIPVADTNSTGFPSSYGVLVIGDEQIIYTGKTATSFTGCARGQFGTTASGHASGVAVRGLFVAGYLERIHEALVAIETTLGTDGAYNFLAAAATLVSSFAGRTGAVTPANGDYTAAQITNTPSGNLAASTVQAALNELQSDVDGRAELVHEHNASTDITSGLLPVTRGGTGANLSATGGTYHFVRQTTIGGAFAVAAIVADDLPTIPNSKLANASVTVTAGSGLSGGGAVALGASLTLTARVVTIFGRDGNVVAAAGDYHAGQVDLNGSSLGSTVSAALASLDSNKASNSWVGSLESSVGSLNTAMSGAQSDISSLDSRTTSLEGRMTAAENAIASLQSSVSTHSSDISSLLGRVSALEGSSHSH